MQHHFLKKETEILND